MDAKIRLGDLEDNNKIKIREELKGLLKKYKTILNQSTYDYLNALIELDIAVLKKYISNETRLSLSELEIYKDIAKYNLYNYTIKRIRREETSIGKIVVEDQNEFLTISTSQGKIKLFEFNHVENIFGNSIYRDYKSQSVGAITMFRTLPKADLTQTDRKLINEEIGTIKTAINPYGSYYNNSSPLAYNWENKRKQKLKEYKQFLDTIEEYKEPSSKQKKEIEVTNYIHDILNKEFELSEDEFDSTKFEIENLDYSSTGVKKKLTKSVPKLIIHDHIKYI